MVDQQNRGNQNANRSNVGQTGGNMGQTGGKMGQSGGNIGNQGGQQNQQNQQNVEQIRSQLRGINFPATKDELMQQKGDQRIDLGGRNMMFRELLQDVRQDRFQSEQELINNINQSGKLGGPRS